MSELTADFVRALPGGTMDDATFQAIETALDKADAPCQDGGRWLTLPERVAALSAYTNRIEAALAPFVAGAEQYLGKRSRKVADDAMAAVVGLTVGDFREAHAAWNHGELSRHSPDAPPSETA